ncbi:perlucin-like protein [Haliotis cracherodii]|uniref:perlucin-like protein n=1 Tax=Haliotis cracherodii TaxID=6455 RepID=UPI0039E9E625
MKVALVFLAALACALAQTSLDCREGWEAGDDSCYKVMKLKVHWIEAWTYCTAMRSSLVEIESQEEQDLIADILKSKYSNYYEQFWIGLSDMDTEGQWQNMRFKQNATYLNWIPGQPNNDNGRGENCAHINAKDGRDYKWNDHSCNAELNFICEAFPLV